MNYNRHPNNDGTVTARVTCAVVFSLFSFFWLFFFQNDSITVAQHVLSNGHTHYSRTVGAVLITLGLLVLQYVVYCILRLKKFGHALTYFPSMLFLAVLSSFDFSSSPSTVLGFGGLLLLLLWGALIWALRSMGFLDYRVQSGIFSRIIWVNCLIMSLLMIMVASTANTNAVFHYRAHAENAMMAGDYDEAIRVGNRSLETDSSLMMVRMYALSKRGQLGDRLFYYPLVATSKAMLPTADGEVRMMYYPADSLYRHLGAIPRRAMQPMEYLETIIRNGQAKPAAADYLLCGYLIDKDLDGFVNALTKYYTVDESLPRHYREALVLYTHRRSKPVLVYHDSVLDVDYNDLQQMEASCATETERKGKVLENYANSYWYYFEYAE